MSLKIQADNEKATDSNVIRSAQPSQQRGSLNRQARRCFCGFRAWILRV